MPLLRNAVERRRKHVIGVLINTGIYKQEDIQSLTLSELEVEYKKLSVTKKKKGANHYG